MTDEKTVFSYYIIQEMRFSQAELFMLHKTVCHLYQILNYVHTHVYTTCAIADLFCLFIS